MTNFSLVPMQATLMFSILHTEMWEWPRDEAMTLYQISQHVPGLQCHNIKSIIHDTILLNIHNSSLNRDSYM